MKKLIFVLISLFCGVASAQLNTTVSGNVTDSTGQSWVLGTITATLVNSRGGQITQNGVVVPASAQTVVIPLDGSGSFAGISLLNNVTLQPAGTQWSFSVCSYTVAPCSTLGPYTITGSTQNLTTQLALVTPPKFPTGPASFGYADSEVSPAPQVGGLYYNVINSIQRIWNGSGWVNNAGGGSSTGGFDRNDTTFGYFTDLDPTNAGGIAAATTQAQQAAVEHATSLAAACWSEAHGGARATFSKSTLYPAAVSNLYIGSNVNFYASTVQHQTYTGGAVLTQYIAGSNTMTGGNSAVQINYAYADTCAGSTVTLGGNSVDMEGFSISGTESGGNENGVLVEASGVHVQDVACSQLGGQCIVNIGNGVNNSFDWNYATNVAYWFQNTAIAGTQLTSFGAAMTVGIDGEASHNQLSTGFGFREGFHVNPFSYGWITPLLVAGAGDYVSANLLQTDEIGMIVENQDNRIVDNRIEYQSAELIRNTCENCTFTSNKLISGALDSNAPVAGVNKYYGIVDTYGSSTYSANTVGQDAGVDGPSYYRGSYYIGGGNIDVSNICDGNFPDAYGNGQCWWAGDLFANGGFGPTIPQTTEYTSTTTIPWIGNYAHLVLDNTSPLGLISFVGMSDGQSFDVIMQNTADTLISAPTGGYYGRPAVITCDGYTLQMAQGRPYTFIYHNDVIKQTSCPANGGTQATFNFQGQPSLPSAINTSTVHLFGTASIGAEPTYDINRLQNDLPTGSLQYCYAMEYWADGAYFSGTEGTTHCITTNVTPSSGSTTNTYIGATIYPQTIKQWNIYRISSTDPAVTTFGIIGSGTTSQPGTVDIGQTITNVAPPIPNQNTSARLNLGNTSSDAIAVTTNTTCNGIPTSSDVWEQNGTLNYCYNGVPYILTANQAPSPATAQQPTLSLASGSYNGSQPLTMTTSTPGAIIYYTLDGSTPTTSSLVYSVPLTVAASETVTAIAIAFQYNNSPLAIGNYVITSVSIANPVFTLSAGTYSSPQNTQITESTGSTTIEWCYTGVSSCSPNTSTNRSAYSLGTNIYINNNPVTLCAQATLTSSGVQSSTTCATYYITASPSTVAATPVISLASGTYTGTQTVTITESTPNTPIQALAPIFYTVDGSTPDYTSTRCSSPCTVTVAASLTLNALSGVLGSSQPNEAATASGWKRPDCAQFSTSTSIVYVSVVSNIATIVLSPASVPSNLSSGVKGNFSGISGSGLTALNSGIYSITSVGTETYSGATHGFIKVALTTSNTTSTQSGASYLPNTHPAIATCSTDDPGGSGIPTANTDPTTSGDTGIVTSGCLSNSGAGPCTYQTMTPQANYQTNILQLHNGGQACDHCTWLLFDTWVNPSNLSNISAMEHDQSIFDSTDELNVGFGMQWCVSSGCKTGSSEWDIGGNASAAWTPTGVTTVLPQGTYTHVQKLDQWKLAEITTKPCVAASGTSNAGKSFPCLYSHKLIIGGVTNQLDATGACGMTGGCILPMESLTVGWNSLAGDQYQIDAYSRSTPSQVGVYIDEASFYAFYDPSSIATATYTIH